MFIYTQIHIIYELIKGNSISKENDDFKHFVVLLAGMTHLVCLALHNSHSHEIRNHVLVALSVTKQNYRRRAKLFHTVHTLDAQHLWESYFCRYLLI